MKKLLLFIFSIVCFTGKTWAQLYSPIATTGYNLDAVAENTTALATTNGTIDGSSFVLYSAAYGQLYNPMATGLPNNGLISSGIRTYQLEPYTQNNLLYIMALQMDSLTLSTPAQYPSVSLLAFATEGPGAMNVKLRFTDGSTQLITNVPLPDWYNTAPTNTVITGFDRASRTTGLIDMAVGNTPRMVYIDLNLDCANRQKLLQRIVIQNTTNNPRLCIMAAAGGVAATYTVSTSPVTCAGGNNGSATVAVSAGVPPYTYTWATSPVQTMSVANLLPVGVTNFTVNDASGCSYASSATIGQALVPPAPLVINASANPVCAGGMVTLSTSGAATYTWSNNGPASSTTVAPLNNTSYNVVATTSANCTLTGSLTVTVTPLPVLTFTVIPDRLCLGATGITLAALPSGGTFSGPGISFGTFFPGLAGVGTQTVAYSYTDALGCSSETVVSTTISSPTTVVGFTITPSTICIDSPSLALNGSPAGGIYAGLGVTGAVFFPSVAGLGTKTVSYTYTDANNCTAKKVSSIVVNTCSYTGIDEQTAASVRCELYPNPNNGSFTLKAGADLELTIINELGQALQTIQLNQNNHHQASIDHLAPGIYFLTAQDQVLKQKIVVTH